MSLKRPNTFSPELYLKTTTTTTTFNRALNWPLIERRRALLYLLWLSPGAGHMRFDCQHWLWPSNSSPSFPEGAEFGHCKPLRSPVSWAFKFGHSLNSLPYVFGLCQRWRSKCVANNPSTEGCCLVLCSLFTGLRKQWVVVRVGPREPHVFLLSLSLSLSFFFLLTIKALLNFNEHTASLNFYLESVLDS